MTFKSNSATTIELPQAEWSESMEIRKKLLISKVKRYEAMRQELDKTNNLKAWVIYQKLGILQLYAESEIHGLELKAFKKRSDAAVILLKEAFNTFHP